MRRTSQPTDETRRTRAISTAIDVTLALVILSLSVSMLMMYTTDAGTGDPVREPVRADQTAETLLSATVTTEYSVGSVRTDPRFDTSNVAADTSYTREVHGTPVDLLADAAVTNGTFTDGSLWNNTGRLTVTGQPFEAALAESIYARMIPAESNYNVTAVWRPYENASIVGTASSGETPPSDADVHSVTTTVPSGMAPVQPNASRDFDAWGDVIAESIVDGYFPEQETQLALEQRGLERELTYYRYKRFETFVANDVDLGNRTTAGGPLNRSVANSSEANDRLTAALSDRIAAELADNYASPGDVEEGVQVSEVQIVVRVWDE